MYMYVGKSQKCCASQYPGILWPPIAAIGFGQFLTILGQFRVCLSFFLAPKGMNGPKSCVVVKSITILH